MRVISLVKTLSFLQKYNMGNAEHIYLFFSVVIKLRLVKITYFFLIIYLENN